MSKEERREKLAAAIPVFFKVCGGNSTLSDSMAKQCVLDAFERMGNKW